MVKCSTCRHSACICSSTRSASSPGPPPSRSVPEEATRTSGSTRGTVPLPKNRGPLGGSASVLKASGGSSKPNPAAESSKAGKGGQGTPAKAPKPTDPANSSKEPAKSSGSVPPPGNKPPTRTDTSSSVSSKGSGHAASQKSTTNVAAEGSQALQKPTSSKGKDVVRDQPSEPRTDPTSLDDLPFELITAILQELKDDDTAGDGRVFCGLSRTTPKMHEITKDYLYRDFFHYVPRFSANYARSLVESTPKPGERKLGERIKFVGYGIGEPPKAEFSKPTEGKKLRTEISSSAHSALQSVIGTIFTNDHELKQKWLEALGEDTNSDRYLANDKAIMAAIICLVPRVEIVDLLHNRWYDEQPLPGEDELDLHATGLLSYRESNELIRAPNQIPPEPFPVEPSPTPGIDYPEFSNLRMLSLDMYGISALSLDRTLALPSLKTLKLGHLAGMNFARIGKFKEKASSIEHLIVHKSILDSNSLIALITACAKLVSLDYSDRWFEVPPKMSRGFTGRFSYRELVAKLAEYHGSTLKTLKLRLEGHDSSNPMPALRTLTVLSEVMLKYGVLQLSPDVTPRVRCLADYFPPSLSILHILYDEGADVPLETLYSSVGLQSFWSNKDKPSQTHPKLKQISMMSENDDPTEFEPLEKALGKMFKDKGVALKLEGDGKYLSNLAIYFANSC